MKFEKMTKLERLNYLLTKMSIQKEDVNVKQSYRVKLCNRIQ